uniref:DNA repair protein endonuclease SAE2/CtIP C-terminus n=1 Tax=Siphoviridae sp. ctICF6 TaxID=2825427 RepID=A0A8S5UL81_9CAUD|nr:MAG TPA: DNA repair protein endonuclease SAE2/CtIP C-terminus [Siphoviridae sp. ctICF6]
MLCSGTPPGYWGALPLAVNVVHVLTVFMCCCC